MMRNITTGWNFFRAARILLGVGTLIQAVLLREWPIALAGLFLSGIALANAGCGASGCITPGKISNMQQNKNKEIEYAELDNKK